MAEENRSTRDVRLVPSEGDRGEFTRSEVRQAFAKLRELIGASEWNSDQDADNIYDQDPGFGFVFDEYILSAISIVSDDLFERVRKLLSESEDETDQRMERFYARVEEFRRSLNSTNH